MRILRSFEWNNHRYVVVEQDDGSRIEIKGDSSMMDKQAMASVPSSVVKLEQPVEGLISEFSDQEIAVEASRRKLVVRGLAI